MKGTELKRVSNMTNKAEWYETIYSAFRKVYKHKSVVETLFLVLKKTKRINIWGKFDLPDFHTETMKKR